MNGLDSNAFNGAIDIKNSRSPIPIRRPGPSGLQQQQQQLSQPSTSSSYLDNLPSFQLPPAETRGRANTTSNMPPPTSLGNYGFHPASVPVSGLYGAPMMVGDAAAMPFGSGVHPLGLEPQQRHAYPKHGKRRADVTPHVESYLRGDQRYVETFVDESALTTASSTDGLPSASFTFTYPPPNAFENYFDMSPSATGAGGLATVPEKSALVGGQDTVLFPTSSPAGLATSPELQMAARIAATAVEEGEARLGGPLPGLPQSFDGNGGGYTMLGAMYGTNGFDGLGGIDPMMSTMYTTVDPQILAPSLTGDFGRTEPSPPGGNACGLFYKLHGVTRPLSLKTDVIKKRNRASGTLSSSARKSAGSTSAAAAAASKARGTISNIPHAMAPPARPIAPSAAAGLSQQSMKRQRRASDGNFGN
ncbi:hypothetical protein FRC00_001133 [Tulasnella sp. 408]|nr:hypothetical protein FRC00_001133 [Tulasnella sp. 408]